MEKHIDIQQKNIKIETDYIQQFAINDVCIKKEREDNNDEEFTDFGCNIDKNKQKNSNNWTVSVNKETNTIIKTEKDETVFNGCVFISEIENEIPRSPNKKKAHLIDPIENCNNLNLTVGGQIHNHEYQCNICNKRFLDKYNLEIHKSLHANTKKFKCITCGEQFFELNGLKSHLISHIDNNIKLLENQFIQECNDVGDCNSNLCNNITMLDGLKTRHSEGEDPIQKRTINKVQLEFSVEIENIFSIKDCSRNSNLTVGNAVDYTHISLDELNPASSVGQKEYKNDKMYYCEKCSLLFHDRSSIIDHLKPHIDQCINCCKYIGSPTSCKYPVSFHPGTPFYFECEECCNKKFASKTGVKNHLQTHLKKIKKHKCRVCNKTFSQNAHLNEHEKIHKNFKPYVCNICKKSFISRNNYTNHLNQHTGARPFVCGNELTDWKMHKTTHLEQKNFECNECNKKFARKYDVKNHLQTHLKRTKKHKCRVCNKKFFKNYHLYQHEKIHKDFKPYVCNVCNKGFIARLSYINHLNQHTGARPFVCDLCGKTYPAIKSLMRHKKINHTCDICNKFYSDPKELKVHKTTHEEFILRQYACKLCDKAFRNQPALDKHELTHLAEKPFKCDLCPKSYINNTVLAIHRRKHTGERPYKCKLCNKTYPRISSLTRHKAIVHNK